MCFLSKIIKDCAKKSFSLSGLQRSACFAKK